MRDFSALFNRLNVIQSSRWGGAFAGALRHEAAQAAPGLQRAFWLAAIFWVSVMIGTPIALWILGDGVFSTISTLGVLAQALAALLAARIGKSTRWIAGAFLVVGLGAWGAEAIGASTGFPFGNYHYTELLQPQFGGVPLLIPLAWWMMLAPSWGVAEAILLRWQKQLGRGYPFIFAALAGAVMTAWDLYLDPQMVSRGLWVWDQPGGYFGIPWINYAGWWLVASLLTLATRPTRLPRLRLIVIYALTWVLQAIGLGIFWGQPGPALVGFLVMGGFITLAVRTETGIWNR